jgi:pyruvate,orthophosphate dikinase
MSNEVPLFIQLYTDEHITPQIARILRTRGYTAQSAIEVGICGEHGGDPSSIEFCHRAGLNYVSCSPYRVPVARLAAAQAALGAVVRDK